MACGACQAVEFYTSTIGAAAADIFGALGPGMAGLVGAVAGIVWAVWVSRAGIAGGFDWSSGVSQSIWIAITTYLMGDYGQYRYWVYDPAQQLMTWLGASAINGSMEEVSGIGGLVEAVENVARQFYGLAVDIWSDGPYEPSHWLAGLLIVIPVTIQLLGFALYVAFAQSLLSVVLAFGPVFLGLAAFTATRRFLVGGLDLIALAFGLVAFSALFAGISARAMSSAFDMTGEYDEWLFSAEFVTTLVVLFLSAIMQGMVPYITATVVRATAPDGWGSKVNGWATGAAKVGWRLTTPSSTPRGG